MFVSLYFSQAKSSTKTSKPLGTSKETKNKIKPDIKTSEQKKPEPKKQEEEPKPKEKTKSTPKDVKAEATKDAKMTPEMFRYDSRNFL